MDDIEDILMPLTVRAMRSFARVSCPKLLLRPYIVPYIFSVFMFAPVLTAQDWTREIEALKPASGEGEQSVLDDLQLRAGEALAAIRRASTHDQADQRRPALRHTLEDSLGARLLSVEPAAKARVAGTVRAEGYLIEEVVYEIGYGAVAAHFYLPAHVRQPVPAILFYPGHWFPDAKARPDFQAFCINMARMGFAVLIWDPFGQGERGISSRDHRRAEALLVGISQEGLAEYETRCALSYLLSRKEVDANRIGMTGASGGGYNTWITAALDDRIAAAVPVVGTSEFLQQIAVTRSYNWDPKDYCHYLPGLIRFANNHELLAMAAPKPIRVIAAADDTEFPITGVRSICDYGRQLYTSYGVPERISLFEDHSAGHGYQQKKREAAYGWFLRWLMQKGDGTPYPEPATATLPYDSLELRCFPSGQNQAAGPGIIEQVKRLATDLPSQPLRYNLRSMLGLPSESPGVQGVVRNVQLQRLNVPSERKIELPAFLLKPKAESRGVLIGIDDGGKEALATDLDLGRIVGQNWAMLGLDPRGIGELSTPKMTWVSAVSLLLNENFVGRQAFDIVRAIEYLRSVEEFRGKPFALYARGPRAALAATYVTGLRSDLERVVLQDGFISFRQFFDRPHSLFNSFQLSKNDEYRTQKLDREIPLDFFVFDAFRKFDLPDLLASTAARVFVVNPIDGDWDRMAQTDARKLLPPSIAIVSNEHPDHVVTGLLTGMHEY